MLVVEDVKIMAKTVNQLLSFCVLIVNVNVGAEAITFLPLAVDTFGGWHKVCLKTITRLGTRRQLARNLGKDEDETRPETGRPHRQGQRGNDGKPTPNLRPPRS